jgi:hypothetical protein
MPAPVMGIGSAIPTRNEITDFRMSLLKLFFNFNGLFLNLCFTKGTRYRCLQPFANEKEPRYSDNRVEDVNLLNIRNRAK